MKTTINIKTNQSFETVRSIMNNLVNVEDHSPSSKDMKNKRWCSLMKYLLTTTAFYGSEKNLSFKNLMNFNWEIKKRKQTIGE